jgi:hypothetical protein
MGGTVVSGFGNYENRRQLVESNGRDAFGAPGTALFSGSAKEQRFYFSSTCGSAYISMKNLLVAALLFSMGFNVGAQTNQAGHARSSQVKDSPFEVVARDANSRVWQRTTYETLKSGKVVPHAHRYTEVATGLHYKDQQTGQWIESKEQIDITPAGAEAVHGQHQVYFPSDIYDGVIEVVTPDGKHLKSRPAGISYYDGRNSILIAQLKHSVGQVSASGNQVIYPDAFTDFSADLICTYHRWGFECDLVLREKPPTPERFKMNSDDSRLELLTEFFDTTEPQQIVSRTAGKLSKAKGPVGGAAPHLEAADPLLKFGAMTMSHGKAFSIEAGSAGISRAAVKQSLTAAPAPSAVPVLKTWGQVQGRTFLIESVPVQSMAHSLQALPAAGTPAASAGPALRRLSATRLLPPMRAAQARRNGESIQVAKADLEPKPGFVLDYIEMDGDQDDVTFVGNQTYYISSVLNVWGTATFEAGTVVKYNSDPDTGGSYNCIGMWGGANFETGPYLPAIFTSQNDDSVGEQISVPGTPMEYWQALTDAYGGVAFHDICIRHSNCGIQGFDMHASDVQFVQCERPFWNEWGTLYATNILMVAADMGFSGQDFTATVYHLTVDGCANLIAAHYFPDWTNNVLILTNCLLANVQSDGYGTLVTSHAIWTGTAAVFQTAGAGEHYLAAESPYRGAGAVLDADIRALLASKTTYPPMVYSNTTFTADMTFNPAAPRDLNASPDLGYHYDPIDYEFAGVDASANLTFGPGTAVGWFPAVDPAGTDYCGLRVLKEGNLETVTFHGTVSQPCQYASYNTVQENGSYAQQADVADPDDSGSTTVTATGLQMDYYYLDDDFSGNPALQATFTKWSLPAGALGHLSSDLWQVSMNNSEFYNGAIFNNSLADQYVNCLFDGSSLTLSNDYDFGASVQIQDCTFHGGNFIIQRGSDFPITIKDTAFDGTTLTIDDYLQGFMTDFRHNAFSSGADHLESMSDGWIKFNPIGGPFEVLGYQGNLDNTPVPVDVSIWSDYAILPDTADYPLVVVVLDEDGNPIAQSELITEPAGILTANWDGTDLTMTHNAIGNPNDLTVDDFNWQSGPLGNFYLPSDSTLINAGSAPANQLGLYHFTTQTNQVKEANSTVDIGYHYVATDGGVTPLDTDGDGTPDYIEDANGNGLYDNGEVANWRGRTPDTSGLINLKVYTPLK